MKKSFMRFICLICLLSFIIAGCSTPTAAPTEEAPATAAATEVQSDEVVNIEIFTRFADGASKTYFDEVAASFNEANPNIKVTVTSADNQTYKTEIGTRLASDSAPDIYFAWSGIYAKNFVDGGKALDLSSYLSADTDWSSKIMATQFGPFTFNSGVYGVPIIMDGKAFYYNEDIFKELGLAVPQNWDEFMSVLNVLKESKYIPISLGNIDDWATGHYMTTLNQRVVPADVLAKDYALEGDANFTDPTYVQALGYLQQLVPYFTPECNSVTYDQGINDFLSGKAAIYYEQFNQVQYIEPATFNWSWFDFPDITGAAGDQNALTGAPQGFMVSATTKHPAEAVAFLKYLTSVDMAAKMVKETSMISTVDGAINSDSASPKLIAIAESIKAASSINLWLDNATNSEVVAVYLQGIQAMVGGAMTPEEVMTAVQQKAAEVKAAQ
ncbi:MAG: extracellular solute-binding protein [Anaerolineaceae bacterium]|nr:extracellular solute-binding protein [Anaerolineaceae bacterium]